MKKQSQLADLVRETDAVIWDEVSPQSRYQIEAVNRCLMDIRDCQDDFSGLTMVFGGDWAQTLPVVNDGNSTAARVIEECFLTSPLWPKLIRLHLTQNMRLQGADEATKSYTSWLQKLSYDPSMREKAVLVEDVHLCDDENDLLHHVYPPEQLALALQIPEFSDFFFRTLHSVYKKRRSLCH